MILSEYAKLLPMPFIEGIKVYSISQDKVVGTYFTAKQLQSSTWSSTETVICFTMTETHTNKQYLYVYIQ